MIIFVIFWGANIFYLLWKLVLEYSSWWEILPRCQWDFLGCEYFFLSSSLRTRSLCIPTSKHRSNLFLRIKIQLKIYVMKRGRPEEPTARSVLKLQKKILRRFARSALWAFLTQPRRSWLTCIFCTWSEHLTLYRISHQIHKADFPPFLRDGIFGKKLCSSSSKRLRNGSSAFLLTWLE